MSPTPQIVGIGELLWDLLPSGARLGGTTTNFSVFCARLGNRAVLVSSVGDDQYGRNAESILVQPNLDLQLQLDPAHATGTVEVTFSADNQPSYLFPIGVAWDFIRLTSRSAPNSSCRRCSLFRHLGATPRGIAVHHPGFPRGHHSPVRARFRHQYKDALVHPGGAPLVA